VIKRSKEQRCLVVVGTAGTGKSALAAAMAWPKVSEPMVPAEFVQAIALFTEATTPLELARAVGEQLARVVPDPMGRWIATGTPAE
jgi:KaiC/GvpD/RAD55 family RecA-like ATPase